LGLPLIFSRAWCAACCLACTAVPPRTGPLVVSEVSRTPATEAPSELTSAAATVLPHRSELFFARTLEGELVLRAFASTGLAPFNQLLARDVQHVLYNPELELFWYSDAARLWVIDTHNADASAWQPVLIASHLPQNDRLHVERDRLHYTGPGRIDDETLELELHWGAEPWIEGGEGGGRLENLDGKAWLARERARPPRSAPAAQFFLAEHRVALPPGWAGCQGPDGICAAALPFGPRGWELVVTNEDLGGDFLEHACRLHDPATNTFATPPDAPKWASLGDVAPGPCGPYLFNHENTAFLIADVVCAIGSTCTPLDGQGSGWLEPGAIIGNE
jgi:hypothetical protein